MKEVKEFIIPSGMELEAAVFYTAVVLVLFISFLLLNAVFQEREK